MPSSAASGALAATADVSKSYSARVASLMHSSEERSPVPREERGKNPAEVEIILGVGGTILGTRLTKSSGSKTWDEHLLQSIAEVRRLPLDGAGKLPQRIVVAFNP